MLSVRTITPRQFREHTHVTILGLGRGVRADGTLSDYGKDRVHSTLAVARRLQDFGLTVQIIWTGGASRIQVAADALPARSEGEAMLDYALTWPVYGTFDQSAETKSISTLENMVLSSPSIKHQLIVTVTDSLHYMFGRVRFLAWLIFPNKKIIHVKIDNAPDVSWKDWTNQVISTILTVLVMANVTRGDLPTIQARQKPLERLAGIRR